jgi:hypothetical protein
MGLICALRHSDLSAASQFHGDDRLHCRAGVQRSAASSHRRRIAAFLGPWPESASCTSSFPLRCMALEAEMLVTGSRRSAPCSPMNHLGDPECHDPPPIGLPLMEAAERCPHARGRSDRACIATNPPPPRGMMHDLRSFRNFAHEDRGRQLPRLPGRCGEARQFPTAAFCSQEVPGPAMGWDARMSRLQ